jgi:predicted dehydrogenase
LSGAFLPGSPYAQGWRLERGAVLDVGPHQLDLHEAALGDVVELRAAGDLHGWVSAVLQHESGATSELALCCRVGGDSSTVLELYGPAGTLHFDGRSGNPREQFANLRRTLVAVANGKPHVADVTRGVHLQRLVADIESQLTA